MYKGTANRSLRTPQITTLILGIALMVIPAVQAEAQCSPDPGNDNLAAATALSGCGTTSAAIDCAGDLDYYWLNAPNSGSFTFETTGSMDTMLKLYDFNGDVIADDDDSGAGNNAKIVWTLVGGQKYSVAVNEYYNTGTGDYDLIISGCSACGDDPGNDTVGNNTPFGTCGTTTAAIDCSGDVDVYSFQAPAAGEYTFTSSGLQPTITSVGFGSGWVNNGTNSIDRTLTSGQWIYVQVEAATVGQIFEYDLTISGCDTACGDDPGDDDMDNATRFVGCTTITAALDCNNDKDFYWFTPFQEGTHVIETLGSTDTKMRLYDNTRTEIADDDDDGVDDNASISHYLQANQVYYIEIWEYSNGTGIYQLRVNCPGGGNCGDDPADDHPAYATPLSGCGTHAAGIECQGDMDHYSFTAPASGTYTFAVTSSYTMDLTLLDGLGSQVLHSGQGSLVWTLNSGDDVILKVEDAGSSYSYSYSLDVSGCASSCGSDPGNDNLAAATPLQGCGTTVAAIDCVGDHDYYWFNAPNSGSFTFETTGDTDTEMKLYDFNGDVIASDDDSGTDHNAKIVHTLISGQKYSVAVNEYNNNATGAYDLVISGCTTGCGNDPGNDDSGSATPIQGCGLIQGAMDCAGDSDWYGFQASEGSTFTWTMSPTNRAGMILYASDGVTEIDAGQNSVSAALIQGDALYLAVSAADGQDTFSYTMTMTGCTQGSCGNDPGNDNLAEATALSGCGSTVAAIDCIGDLDYYWFNAPNSGSFTFETTGSMDTMLKLYDFNGDVIADDDDSGDGNNAKIVHTLVSGQKYSVAVNDYQYDDTGDYTLVITGCGQAACGTDPGNDDFGAATALQGCGTTSAGIDCAGDEDYYRFTPPIDGPYTITLQASFNTLLELYDSGHHLLAQQNYQITWNLQNAAGPYFIAVVSPLDLLGTYDLSISGCSAAGCPGDTDGDSIGGATTFAGCGSTQTAFDCTGDVDYFKFTPTISGDHIFETTGSMDTKMWLQNTQGADLAFDDDSGQGLNSHITHTLQSGILYFVRLEEYNNDDTGAYGLTIAGCNASSCGQDSEGDTISTAVSLSTCGVTDAEFDCATDVDVFRFQAPLSVTYTFATEGSKDTFMRLLDGNGNQLATNDNAGSGSNARLTRSLTAGEAVYLEVTENGGGLGEYQVEIDGCTATGEPPNEWRYIVTAAAKVGGSEGTNWVSDLAMLNLGESNADITIALWERDHTNTNPQEALRTLTPGQLERTTDVLATMFGRSTGAAALQIRSDQPLAIGSRTYNTVKGKTYGQFIPGVAQQDAIPSGERVYLAGLAENHAFRTNLGLVNPGDSEIDVTATFFDSNAQQLGSRTWPVPAHSYIQRNRVLRELTTTHMHSIWIRLTADSGEFFSFFSIVDQDSGDPVYRPGRTSPLLAEDVLMPGVAKLAGAAGTNWVTDATFINTTTSDASVKISLWNRGGDNSNPAQRSFLLKAEQMTDVSDVLFSLFGENAGAAALHLAVEPGIIVDGRTYNLVKEGTYGQYIPGLGEGSAVTAHRKGYLVMPVQNTGFRSNLGLVNPSDQPVDVQVKLFNAAGNQVGADHSWRLDPREVKQIDRIMKQFTSQNMDAGWLEVSVKTSTPDGKVQIFNSVIDMESGDPIFETITLGP